MYDVGLITRIGNHQATADSNLMSRFTFAILIAQPSNKKAQN